MSRGVHVNAAVDAVVVHEQRAGEGAGGIRGGELSFLAGAGVGEVAEMASAEGPKSAWALVQWLKRSV